MNEKKTLYPEEEVLAATNRAAYVARVATVLSLLAEEHPGGIVAATLADIMRDYGIPTATPEDEEHAEQ